MKRPRRGRSCDIHTYTTRKSARILLFYYSYFIIYTPFQKARDQCDRARDDSRMDSEKVLKRRRKRLLNDWGYSRETLVAYFVNNI